MAWINHPLLVSGGDIVPPSPSFAGPFGACQSYTNTTQLNAAAPNHLTISEADITFDDGDWAIIVCAASVSSDSTSQAFEPNQSDLILLWGQSGNEAIAVYAVRLFTGFGSYSFVYNWNSATVTLCWRAWVLGRVSNRCPVDYVVNPSYGGITDYDSFKGIIRYPALNQHGVDSKWFHMAMYSNTTPAFDWAEANFITPGASQLQYETFVPGNRATDIVWHRMRVPYCTNNASGDGDTNYGTAGTMGGWSTTNCTVGTTTVGSIAYSSLTLNGDGTSKAYYLRRTVSLEAGKTYYFRIKAGNRVSASSDYFPAFGIVHPSTGVITGRRTGTWSTSVGSVPAGWATPDWAALTANGYSGLPSYPCGEFFMEYTADETGDYEARLYVMDEDLLTFSESGDRESYVTCLGFAWAEGAIPTYVTDTGLMAETYQKAVPDLVYKYPVTDVDNPATFIYGSCMGQVVGSDVTTFNPVTLVDYTPWAEFTRLDTGRVGISTFPQANRYRPPSTYVYRVLVADRIVLPYYYATEAAASTTEGKYYWEVTLAGNPSSGNFALGACPTVARPIDPSGALNRGVVIHALYGNGGGHDGDNKIATGMWGDVLEAGDVVGFALDIPGNAMYAYLNGSLVYTWALNVPVGENAVLDQAAWRALVMYYATAEESGVRCSFECNFTGPFTYTKPTGYVAYDWLNEVA